MAKQPFLKLVDAVDLHTRQWTLLVVPSWSSMDAAGFPQSVWPQEAPRG